MGERLTYIPPEATGSTEEQEETKAKIRQAKNRQWEHFTPEFVGTKAQELHFETALKEIDLGQKNFQETRISQAEGRVRFKGELPVAIVFLGDLHWGSVYTNHQEVLRKFKKIKETPNAYCILMSNLIDNAIPARFPHNMLTNSIPPDKQVIMMRKMIQDLNSAGKVLGAVGSPCHEGWTFATAGQDINAMLFGFPDRKFPILENGGRLHIQMGKIDYLGALYHQVGPFESNFNETHALRQLNRLKQRMECSWIAGAHKHFAATEEVYEGTGDHRRLCAYIRTGSEKGTGKIHDQWAQERYGDTGEPSGQVLHLWPDKRQLATNVDFDIGILAHESFYLTGMVKNEQRNSKS